MTPETGVSVTWLSVLLVSTTDVALLQKRRSGCPANCVTRPLALEVLKPEPNTGP
jgi:hypothetical protein